MERLRRTCDRVERPEPRVRGFAATLGCEMKRLRRNNPRTDERSEHFRLDGAVMEPLTAVGRVTIRLLKLNNAERIRERKDLIDLGFLS